MAIEFDDDQKSWEQLRANFRDDRGIIRRKAQSYQPTEADFAAINHLCDDWDYCWEGI